jgi:hypothetical protein
MGMVPMERALHKSSFLKEDGLFFSFPIQGAGLSLFTDHFRKAHLLFLDYKDFQAVQRSFEIYLHDTVYIKRPSDSTTKNLHIPVVM